MKSRRWRPLDARSFLQCKRFRETPEQNRAPPQPSPNTTSLVINGGFSFHVVFGEGAHTAPALQVQVTGGWGVLCSDSIFNRKGWKIMRIFLNIVAVLLILVGLVWFLQGINVLPGSFMTGQTEWAVYGGIAIVAGIGLLVFANRHKNSPPKK
jgi:hypothetical protein